MALGGGVVVATLFTGVSVEDLTTGEASAATKRGRVLHRALPHALSTAPSDCANGEAIATLDPAAIIIGGGPLAAAAEALGRRLPVRVIEPVPAAVRLAAMRVRDAAR